MGRKIRVKIEQVFDEDQINEAMREDGEPFTDEELKDYVLDTFVDDLYERVKYSEVSNAVNVRFEEEA